MNGIEKAFMDLMIADGRINLFCYAVLDYEFAFAKLLNVAFGGEEPIRIELTEAEIERIKSDYINEDGKFHSIFMSRIAPPWVHSGIDYYYSSRINHD